MDTKNLFAKESYKKFSNHLNHTTLLKEYHAHTSHVTATLWEALSNQDETVEIQQIMRYIATLREINGEMTGSLERGSFSTVEALSRVSVEQSVNLIYILNSSDNCYRLLTSYIDKTEENAINWEKYAVRINSECAIQAARGRIDQVRTARKIFPHLVSKPSEKWPSAYQRFKATDLEDFYHNVFSPASNSIHSFSEDMFNDFLMRTHPDPEMKNVLAAEKASFAVFLAASSMLVFLESLCRVADFCKQNDTASLAEKLGECIKSIIEEHEFDHSELRKMSHN